MSESKTAEKLIAEMDSSRVIKVSATTIRKWFDGSELASVKQFDDSIENALDTAQGEIFDGTKEETYVLIRIRR